LGNVNKNFIGPFSLKIIFSDHLIIFIRFGDFRYLLFDLGILQYIKKNGKKA